MLRWEYDHRCRLEADHRKALDGFKLALDSSGDLEGARRRLDRAQEELFTWDEHVVQVSSPPQGMVAVFERRDGLEELIPVSYLGLQRSGRVVPYILLGNCEPKVPSHIQTFLRIDFKHFMAGEVALLEASATEPTPNVEELWSAQQ